MGEWMVAIRSVCLRLALVAGMTSCAQGYADDPLGIAAGSTAMGGQSGRRASDPIAGSSAGSAGSAAYSGETCRMGESAACTCESTGWEGSKTCRYDARSPTMGTFPECGNCIDPNAVAQPDPGNVMGSAGGSGRAGSGTAAGSGASGGSTGTGGAGGSGSSGGSRGGCTPACNQSCFPAGVLACCRSNGTCGCTWAPGAYCL